MKKIERQYRCAFCDKEFIRKSWFDKHQCAKKKRFMESNNLNTIKALRLFNHWQRRTGLLFHGKEKTLEEFCKSPFYNTFMKLVSFTNKEYIVSGFKYLDWLVEESIPERDWFNERDLHKYHEYIRRNEEARSQAETTCRNIKAWCQKHESTPMEFFKRITPGQALNMVKENRLSPWVLFSYRPCVENLTSRLEGEVLFTLDEHINVNYWLDKIKSEYDKTEVVEQICREYIG
jgi:hypothetical protein